jgi:hypothetical protein
MSAASTRWNLVISSAIYKSLCQFLATEGGGKSGDLSRFVEDEVNKRIFEMTARLPRSRMPESPRMSSTRRLRDPSCGRGR